MRFLYNKCESSKNVTPGRDFHGTVISTGCAKKYHVGDHVVGIIPPLDNNGALSEFISPSSKFSILLLMKIVFKRENNS